MKIMRRVFFLGILLVLAGCGTPWTRPVGSSDTAGQRAAASERGREVVLYALSLVDTGYRFGGKNPQAGLDCSGMVSYVFNQAIGLKMAGSAAEMAERGRPVDRSDLRPGDLVFFNTGSRPYSHVGIYLGEARFIHAPSSNGKVRIDRLDSNYFASRFEAARSYFD